MNNDNKQKVEFDDEDDNRSMDTDNVFYDDDSHHTPQDYTAEEIQNENSRKHSYDSRESASEGSNLSESPCDSLSHNLRPLSMESPYSSTCTVEDIGRENKQELILFSGNPFQTEKEFINYLMSLPSSKAESTTTLHQIPLPVVLSNSKALVTLKPNQTQTTSGTQSPKVGLDHLENLCKLMEQLGELREQNCKLQKRVQYLEEMRCLNEMRKDLKEALEVATTYTSTMQKMNENNPETASHNAHSLREEENLKRFSKSDVKLRKSALKQEKQKRRGRSQSMGDSIEQSQPGNIPSATTTTGTSGQSGKAKVSKWTKVKEALKWERAQVDNRASTGSSSITTTSGGGGGGSGDTRSSFYVDGNHPSQRLMASKGNVSLAKTSKPQHTLSDVMLHGNLQRLPANQNTDVTHYPSSWRTSDLSYDGCGSGEVSAPSFFFRDSYVDTSSNDDDDDDEHYLKEMERIATEGNKRQSLGAMLGLGEQYSSLVSRRKSSPTQRFSNQDLNVDDTQDRKGQSLDRNVDPKTLSKHAMTEKESKKLAKGTWGKMKNIIQTRKDSLKRKHRKSGTDQGCNITPDLSSGDLSLGGGDNTWEDINDATGCYSSRMHYDDTAEHYDNPSALGQSKSKHSSSSSNYGMEDIGMEMFTHDKMMKNKANKLRPQQLTIQAPPTEEQHFIRQSGVTTQSGYSPTSNRKSKWTKVKKVLLNKREDETNSLPASPTNPKDFCYDDDLKLLEEYFSEEKDWDTQSKHNYETATESDKCQLSTDARRNLEELQRNVSQEFCKKLQEWERLRRAPTKQLQQLPTSDLDRKGSTNKPSKSKADKSKDKQPHDRDHKDCKHREKELQWLEKQLQKIEREKQRLAKERQKYLEREARLEKMKQTMMKPSIKNEILVRTSAGEFRFEGISQTFTRKLYEWEAMKGIGPEVSTIALLDSQQYQPQRSHSVKNASKTTDDKPNLLLAPPVLKYGRLDRSRSRSDGSIADIVNVQTSTTSLVHNDMLADDVFIDDMGHSRANSEPDIVFVSSEPPCAVEVEEMHYEESIPCLEIPAVRIEEPIYSYTPSEVTHLIDSSGSSDAEKECKRQIDVTTKAAAAAAAVIVAAAEEKEDADQLKRNTETNLIQTETTMKNDICKQLESELEDIDDRMKIMFQQHAEEIQDDDEKQLELIEDLRARIQEIEKASEVLEKERVDLQNAFVEQEEASSAISLQETTPETLETSTQLKIPEKQKTNVRKKEGVVKIQAISTELLQQAKTLEEALVERNATIKQLQWELVQRDLSTKILEEELHHGKEIDNSSKKKGNHNRSWSSVDGAYASPGTNREKDNSPKVLTPKPSPLLGRLNNSECAAALPTEITNKVRELKTELMRLWSSGESTTSDQGIEEQLPCYMKEASQGKHKEMNEKDPTQKAPQTNEKQTYETTGKEVEIPKFVDSKLNTKTTKCGVPVGGGEETIVSARRVSDTSVPQDLQITPEFGRQHRRNISRIPKSPDVKKSRTPTASELPPTSLCNKDTKELHHEVSTTITPKLSKLCRYAQSPIMYPRNEMVRQQKVDDFKDNDQSQSSSITVDAASVNYTVSLKKKPTNEKKAVEENDQYEQQVKTSSKSSIMTGPTTSSIPKPCSNMDKKNSTVTEEEFQKKKDNPTVTSESVTKHKEKNLGTHSLLRQNAEDLISSSDTDTEGSGVTFTINIANKERNKKSSEEAEKKLKPVKSDTNGSSMLKKISSNTLRTPPMSRASAISSPPQSPIAPWRKSNANNDKTFTSGQSKIQLTPTMKSKLLDGHSSHQIPMKPDEEIQKEGDRNNLFLAIVAETAPETPVVKSRSTRKLKLPTTVKTTDSGTNSSCGSPLLEPSPLIHRKGLVRSSKETAPNVKMMVEKFNKKIIQEQSSPTMIRSPHLGLQRKGFSYSGVQKSTSFSAAQETPVSDSVVKSASAGIIEESTSRFFGQRYSQSPELSKKQTMPSMSWASQPVGIASRIPRSLKSILEQDSIDTIKETTETESSSVKYVNENGGASTSARRIQSPITDTKSLHARKVRDDFMSKASISSSSSSTSPVTERHPFSTTVSYTTPPSTSKFGLSTHSKHTNIPVPKSPSEGQVGHYKKVTSETPVATTSEYQKPKSILKLLHREPRRSLETKEPITDSTTKIMKSASAGIVEDSITKPSSRSSEDLAIRDSKTPESQQQPHKSGLFHFKFRKAKIKQKKETLNTVQALCRQSLVVDIEESEDGKSGFNSDGRQDELPECGGGGTQSTVSARSCPSSPELQPRQISKGGWLTKPKILFRSK